MIECSPELERELPAQVRLIREFWRSINEVEANGTISK